MRKRMPMPSIAVVLLIALLAGLGACAETKEITVSEIQTKQRLAAEERLDRVKMAAEQGDVKAQTELGAMYWGGAGISRNAPEAVRWWERAASAGNCRAQLFLGHAYDLGDKKLPADTYELAARWYRAAAEQGHPVAMVSLAQHLIEQSTAPTGKILVEAAMWYEVLVVVDPFPDLDRQRKALASAMSPAESREAKKLARGWLQSHREQLQTGECAKLLHPKE